MRTLIKRLTSKTLLVNESSGANEEDSFQRPTTRDRHHKRELQPLLKGDRKGSPLRWTNGTPGFRGIVVALVGPMPLRCTRCLTRQQSLQKGEHYGNEIW